MDFKIAKTIESLKTKYSLACVDLDTLSEQLKDVNKSYAFLQKQSDNVSRQNKKYSNELCDLYELVDEILYKIEHTCFPVQLVKAELNNIKSLNKTSDE